MRAMISFLTAVLISVLGPLAEARAAVTGRYRSNVSAQFPVVAFPISRHDRLGGVQ